MGVSGCEKILYIILQAPRVFKEALETLHMYLSYFTVLWAI